MIFINPGYHLNNMQCMQPNIFIYRSGVPHAHVTLDRKSNLFKLIVKFFLKGLGFIFWHDIVYCVYRVALICDKI